MTDNMIRKRYKKNLDHIEGYQQGSEGEKGGEGTENKQHKWQAENRQGEGKNSVGNVEAKELVCMTHGHELQRGMCEGGVCRMEWTEGKWDNCNSIINKYII